MKSFLLTWGMVLSLIALVIGIMGSGIVVAAGVGSGHYYIVGIGSLGLVIMTAGVAGFIEWVSS